MKKFILSVTLIFNTSFALAQFQKDVIVTSPDGIWTDSRAYTTLNAAITAVGLNDRTVVIASPQTVSTLTVPSNVTLSFERNGSITNTGQLTIQTKNIIAEDRQIFTGAGDVDFAIGSTVRSSWFSTFASAVLITSDDSVTLVISKQEAISSNVTIGNNVQLKWDSPESRLTVNVGNTLSNVGNVEAGDYQLFAGAGDIDFKTGTNLNIKWFEHLRAALTWVETEKVTIYISGTNQVDFTDTVQSNIILDFTRRNGTLSISAGITLTINGGILATNNQVFSGLGTTALANSTVDKLLPQWWGAVGDGTTNDTAAFQSTINAAGGRQISVSGGTYRIDSTLTYNTNGNLPGLNLVGSGMDKTIFDNRVVGGAMISLDGSATPGAFAYGAHLADFKITQTTAPAGSHGIELRSQWAPTIEHVYIDNLTGDGIRIRNDNADPDSTSYMIVESCILNLNDGWGFRVLTPPLTSSVAVTAFNHLLMQNTHIAQNTLGGVYLSGLTHTIQNTSISTNGGSGGLVLPYETGVVNQQPGNITVKGCEFDGNTGYNIDIQAVAEMSIENVKFISAAGIPLIYVSVGRLSTTTSVYIRGGRVRHSSGIATAFSISANANYTRIEDISFGVVAGTLTRYADSGLFTAIRENGIFIRQRFGSVSTTVATSYTPDLYLGSVHRIIASNTGLFDLNAPIFSGGGPAVVDGAELIMILGNGSGGETSFRFNAIFILTSKFLNPSAGLQTSARFIYNSAASAWIQVGSWSFNATTKQSNQTGSYTPDVGISTTHRIFITSVGAFALNAPVKVGGTLTNGDELNLIIGNTSGGVITVTFNAAFNQAGYTDPGASTQKSAKFVYHSGAWLLIGAWSAAY